MKNLVKKALLLTSIIFVLASCQNKKNREVLNSASNKLEVAIQKPFLDKKDDSLITKAQNKATLDKVMKAREKMVKEATQAVLGTQEAIQLLSKNDDVDAINKLEKVIGQIEIVTNKYPDLDIIPIDVKVKTNDLISDISTIKQITKDAERALKTGQLQEAKQLLSGLSSEIDITTVNLPLGVYPKEIEKAVHLIGLNKLEEAKSLLISTTNELVTEQEVVPIPILRAKALLDEAAQKYADNKSKNNLVVINLLDNAKYQLKIAKVLGYGNQDIIFKELNEEIRNLKKSVNKNADSNDLFNKVKSKLKKFKEKIS